MQNRDLHNGKTAPLTFDVGNRLLDVWLRWCHARFTKRPEATVPAGREQSNTLVPLRTSGALVVPV
jgi:hypothetical protein